MSIGFLRTGCLDREYSFSEGLFFLSFFLSWFGQKSMFLGPNYLFPDCSQKLYHFFYIFTSFGVKNICTLFREID